MIKWRLANPNKCRPLADNRDKQTPHFAQRNCFPLFSLAHRLAIAHAINGTLWRPFVFTNVIFQPKSEIMKHNQYHPLRCFIGLLSQSQWLDLWYPDSVSKNTPVHFTRIKVHITVICRCIYITFSHPITSSCALLVSYYVSNLLALVFPS